MSNFLNQDDLFHLSWLLKQNKFVTIALISLLIEHQSPSLHVITKYHHWLSWQSRTLGSWLTGILIQWDFHSIIINWCKRHRTFKWCLMFITSYCLHLWTADLFFFLNFIFGWHKSLLWGQWYPFLGLQVMSALSFKAKVESSLVYFLTCISWIPQILLWCDVCWPFDGQ